MSKLYVVMKNNEKIKTAKSLSVAKEIADQEQAEVFCDGKCVYTASQSQSTELIQAEPKATEKQTIMREEPTLGVALNTKEPHCDSYVLTALMNVRKKPSLEAEVIRKAPKGSFIQVLRLENDWLCIKNGSSEAFIYYKGGEYAKKI